MSGSQAKTHQMKDWWIEKKKEKKKQWLKSVDDERHQLQSNEANYMLVNTGFKTPTNVPSTTQYKMVL